ncbi:MAG TPA: metallophosphoesterase [Paucimonas sp.]|nr:metallophosphoesterase [Paucimonas sp.]
MEPITVFHISDLHISEHLLRGAEKGFYFPHRYGHNVQAFLALDDIVKRSDWDLLLITGDISRIGNIQSFESVRNWLENEILFGETRVGLNLSKKPGRKYLVIPGNHDRFGGRMVQGSLDLYHGEFPVIRSGSVERLNIRGNKVNVHFYDSTTPDGGFAYGRIEPKAMVPKTLSDDEIDLALLHHHFIQPPKHARERATELTNCAEVAAYMLNVGFDGIFFGHTHKGYIGQPSVEILSGMLNDRRKIPRFWNRFFPKFLLRKREEDCLVSYRREAAQNGQLPTLESYFDYLYLVQQGHALAGPASFASIRGFYDQMKKASADERIATLLERAKRKQILISLAPSACQAEAEWNGFHVVRFQRQPDGRLGASWERFEFDGSDFVAKPVDQHD